MDFNGNEVSLTAFRMIAIQSLPNNHWGKIDARILIDRDDDEAILSTVEVQLGTAYAFQKMQEMYTWDLAGRVGIVDGPAGQTAIYGVPTWCPACA